MTDEEALEFYEQLKQHYGKNLANFEHYPKIFAYQVKLFKYYRTKVNQSDE